MPWLVEMEAACSVQVFTSYALFMFTQPDSVWSCGSTNVFTFGVFFTLAFLTFPVVDTVCGFTVNCIFDVVGVACNLSSHLSGGGE